MLESREPLHDYARSRAVVMGTSQYKYLSPVSAAANSLKRIMNVLTGPLCGWPEDRMVVWAEERGPSDLADRLITAFEDVVDIALFYYVGHGQIDLEDQLCLGLVESRTESNRRATTSLGFQAVRRALLQSPATIKIVILDCCFSGLASQPANTLRNPDDILPDIIGGTGAYTMVASGAYNTAWYETDPNVAEPHTYFTRYLAELVERGMPDGAPVIELHALFTELHNNLARDKLPVPTSRSIDGAREFPFAYNAVQRENRKSRIRRIRGDVDVRLNQINRRLAEAEKKEKALNARLDERSGELEELYNQISGSQHEVSEQRRLPLTGVADSAHRRKLIALFAMRISTFTLRRRLAFIAVTAGVATAVIFITSSLLQSPTPGSISARRHPTGLRGSIWTYQTAGLVDSSPVVADGTVYVGSDGGIYALNAVTGSLRWADASVGAVDSNPEVVGGAVYIGSFNPHEVVALDAATGHIRWTYTTGGSIGSSPFVIGGTVYIGSFDGKVYALDAATGHVRWTYTTGGSIDSSPFVIGGTVYIGSFDGKVYALDAATGHLRWTHTTGGPIESSPFVKSGTLYIGSDDHQVYAFNAANGSLRWMLGTEGMVKSSPVVIGGGLFIGSDDDKVYALNAVTGHIWWTYTTEGPVDSSGYIAGGVVYIGSDDHKVYALNISTGHLDWSYTAKGAVQARPIVADGILYVGSFDDKIYALDAATGAAEPAANTRS